MVNVYEMSCSCSYHMNKNMTSHESYVYVVAHICHGYCRNKWHSV